MSMDSAERFSLQKVLEPKDLEVWVTRFKKQLSVEAEQYLESRGILPKTIGMYDIGFQSGKIGFSVERHSIIDFFENRIVIPIRSADGLVVDLIGRAIDSREPKYKMLLGTEDVFFNESVLLEADDVFLCNGLFDALILAQEQLPAVCLANPVLFKGNHAQRLDGKRVLICLGNDELGLRESARIESLLQEWNIESVILHLPENIRDINDFFVQVEDPSETFMYMVNQTIEQAMVEPIAPDFRNITTFNEEYMKRFRGVTSGVPTGIAPLDKALFGGLRSGLYVLVGAAASGKTMLMKQMADQIAAEQTPVIYVSYDLSAFELWARTIARILGVAPFEVINGQIAPERVLEANQTYYPLSQSMWTIEMTLDSSLQQALSVIEKILVTLGRPPVVFIDNLQRIPLSERIEGVQSAQQFHTYLAYRFKEASREWQCPIVCSMPVDARQEQTLPLGVEAAADVIMELRRTAEIGQATSQMEFELIKNRNGAPALFELQFHHERSVFSS